ncbi:hypothetical protein K502DRAFT_322660 [Neoconidiobolus thromboides FSU 785]|nr:hypothetical protein K502DRAFT_322660 [Neoconidiobolus thromboides FSU 785]
MEKNYTIKLSDYNLRTFFNQSSSESIACIDSYCCFGDCSISNDIVTNNLENFFYSICNESYCKVFKGNNKRYKSRPNESNPKEYNIDLSADDFKKDFKYDLAENVITKGNYFCFGDSPISDDIIKNDLNKFYYYICTESCCKVFKGNDHQFESKLDEGKSSQNGSSQSKSSSSIPNPSSSSANNANTFISAKLAFVFSISLLCNFIL